MVTIRANIYGKLKGEWLYYNFDTGSFTQRNFVADFIRLKLNFIFLTNKIDEPLFGDTGVTYTLHLQLVGNPVVNFLFVIIELFRYLLWLKRYK